MDFLPADTYFKTYLYIEDSQQKQRSDILNIGVQMGVRLYFEIVLLNFIFHTIELLSRLLSFLGFLSNAEKQT